MKKEIDICAELRAHIARKYKRQIVAAKAWGVSQGFISMAINGQRNPTDAMLSDMGLMRAPKANSYVKAK